MEELSDLRGTGKNWDDKSLCMYIIYLDRPSPFKTGLGQTDSSDFFPPNCILNSLDEHRAMHDLELDLFNLSVKCLFFPAEWPRRP